MADREVVRSSSAEQDTATQEEAATTLVEATAQGTGSEQGAEKGVPLEVREEEADDDDDVPVETQFQSLEPDSERQAEEIEEKMSTIPRAPTLKEVKLETNTSVACIEANPKVVTLAFCAYVTAYWTGLVIIPAAVRNDLSGYEYWFWMLGMIGTCSIYYAVKAGKAADSPKGKPILAYTCVVIGMDWSAHAYDALDGKIGYRVVIMFFHASAVLWATLFFYKTALESNNRVAAWVSLFVEWLDLLFMLIVILILDIEKDGCLDGALCIGYYAVLVTHVTLWFLPIMFGKSDTSKSAHIHMIVLDCLTDLPLVIIIIAKKAWQIHPFIYVDTVLKMLLLVRSIGYHGVFHLIINRQETDDMERQEQTAIDNAHRKDEEAAAAGIAATTAGDA